MEERPISFILRMYQDRKLVHRSDTAKYLRFLRQTRLINWKKGTSVYLRVNYLDHKDSHNDMTCISNADLDWGIKAFIKEYI